MSVHGQLENTVLHVTFQGRKQTCRSNVKKQKTKNKNKTNHDRI